MPASRPLPDCFMPPKGRAPRARAFGRYISTCRAAAGVPDGCGPLAVLRLHIVWSDHRPCRWPILDALALASNFMIVQNPGQRFSLAAMVMSGVHVGKDGGLKQEPAVKPVGRPVPPATKPAHPSSMPFLDQGPEFLLNCDSFTTGRMLPTIFRRQDQQ